MPGATHAFILCGCESEGDELRGKPERLKRTDEKRDGTKASLFSLSLCVSLLLLSFALDFYSFPQYFVVHEAEA